MPTQQQIAEHLDLDQSAVSRMLDKLGVSPAATLDEVRVAYVRQLRAQASGHRSEDGLDLVKERVLTERVDRELKQLQVAEKRGVLINVEQLEPELMNMIGAFRAELLARDDKLASELSTLYGIDVDVTIINEHTHTALAQLGRYDTGHRGFAAPAGGSADAAGAADNDGVGAATSGNLGKVVGQAGAVQP
jgi:DNA-binding transcriptional regulator LsrR (DeoR family)